DQMALVPQEVFEQLEFARGQVEQPVRSNGPVVDQVHFEVCRLQSAAFRGSTAAQQRANPGEELRQGEGRDQVVISAQIDATDAVVDAISGGQNQDRSVDTALPKGVENVEAVSTRKHQVEENEVENLSISTEKPILACRGDHYVVVLRLQ